MKAGGFISAVLAGSLLWACSHGSGKYLPPSFLDAGASSSGNSVTLSSTLSGGRFDGCGFVLSSPDALPVKIGATADGAAFSCTARGLAPECSYEAVAWISAGADTLRSEPFRFTTGWYSSPEDIVYIPDKAFKQYLLELHDLDSDGEISYGEAARITSVSLCSNELGIESLEGTEAMPNLRELSCTGDWLDSKKLDGLDHYYLSKHYEWPECYGPIGTLKHVDVSHNLKLRVLNLGGNSALGDYGATLDLSNNTQLEDLELSFSWLPIPDMTNFAVKIQRLCLSHLRGALPDFSRMPHLSMLDVEYSDIGPTFIDVSCNPELTVLAVSGTASGISNLSLNLQLWELAVDYCGLRSLNISVLPGLLNFAGRGNLWSELDVSGNPVLKDLWLGDNEKLETLYVAAGQQIEGVTVNRSTGHIPEYTNIVVLP